MKIKYLKLQDERKHELMPSTWDRWKIIFKKILREVQSIILKFFRAHARSSRDPRGLSYLTRRGCESEVTFEEYRTVGVKMCFILMDQTLIILNSFFLQVVAQQLKLEQQREAELDMLYR